MHRGGWASGPDHPDARRARLVRVARTSTFAGCHAGRAARQAGRTTLPDACASQTNAAAFWTRNGSRPGLRILFQVLDKLSDTRFSPSHVFLPIQIIRSIPK